MVFNILTTTLLFDFQELRHAQLERPANIVIVDRGRIKGSDHCIPGYVHSRVVTVVASQKLGKNVA